MTKSKRSPSFSTSIFIAGDLEQAKHICRDWCFRVGACVTVEPVSYIYTGGEESGVRVGLINYPRFPSSEEEMFQRAVNLGNELMLGLFQNSFSVEGPCETVWFSRRES